MKKKVEIVSDFFNTSAYLKNTFNIELRKSIIDELTPSQLINKKVLDIGCGDGSLSIPFIKSNKTVLIDSAQSMLKKAKKKISTVKPIHEPKLIQNDFMEYPFDTKFDLILCIGVVSHISNIDNLLLKIYQLLENDGHAIIQISDAKHYRYKKTASSLKSYGYELNRINKLEFEQRLNKIGLEIVTKSGYSWSFFPINRLSQKKQFVLLNKFRKNSFLKFLSSEWLFLVKKM